MSGGVPVCPIPQPLESIERFEEATLLGTDSLPFPAVSFGDSYLFCGPEAPAQVSHCST